MVSSDAFVLCVKHSHWWIAKEIYGLMFDSRYNIIPITDKYELGQSTYSWNHYLMFHEVPQHWWVLATHYKATSLHFPRLLEPIKFDNTEIHQHLMFWYQFLRNHKTTLFLSVTNYDSIQPSWNKWRLYLSWIFNVLKRGNCPIMPHISQF